MAGSASERCSVHSRAACRAIRRTRETRIFSSAHVRGAAARRPGRLESEVSRDAAALTASRDLEEPFITLSARRLMRHGKRSNGWGLPASTSPLRGSYDDFDWRCRSRRPNRSHARLIVTSLFPNFSAASPTTSTIRIFLPAALAFWTRDNIQRAIARSSSI